jgi:hypothetical protein
VVADKSNVQLYVPLLRRLEVECASCETKLEHHAAFQGGFIFALQNVVTYFLRGFIRFVPDQDTATEVLVVLGIVVAAYFFSRGENFQAVKQQFSISESEASPATSQK